MRDFGQKNTRDPFRFRGICNRPVNVTLLDQTKTREAEILMVTDIDGGLSEIINARLKWE